MKSCPTCDAELDEIFYAAEPPRQPASLLPQEQLKYACPECSREWRTSDDGPLVPFDEMTT